MTDSHGMNRLRRFAEIDRFQTWLRRVVSFDCKVCNWQRGVGDDCVFQNFLVRKMLLENEGELAFSDGEDLDIFFSARLACSKCAGRSVRINYLAEQRWLELELARSKANEDFARRRVVDDLKREEARSKAAQHAEECALGLHGFWVDDKTERVVSGGKRAFDPSSGM